MVMQVSVDTLAKLLLGATRVHISAAHLKNMSDFCQSQFSVTAEVQKTCWLIMTRPASTP